MKKLVLYILLLPFYAIAQESAQPFPDSNLIIIEVNGRPDSVLKQVALVMQEKGYFIQDYNKELLNISSNRVTDSFYNIKVRVNAYIREKERDVLRIYFFGEYNSKNGEDAYQGNAVYNNNLLRRLERIAFEEMDKLIKAYPRSNIIYSKL